MSDHDELSGESSGREAALQRKVFARLQDSLTANFPMSVLHDLICKQAAVVRRASSAPRPLVNALIRRLSAAQRKSIRSGLFKFFVADGDFEAARKYLPKTGTENISEYYPLMIWSLKMGKRKAAERICAACHRFYPQVDQWESLQDEPYVVFQLASAVALYKAAKGNSSNAIEHWELIPVCDPEFPKVRANIVSARLVDALLATTESLKQLHDKRDAENASDSQKPDWQLDATIDRLEAIEHDLLNMLTPSDLDTFKIVLPDDDEAVEGRDL